MSGKSIFLENITDGICLRRTQWEDRETVQTSLAYFRCPDGYRPFHFSSHLFKCFLFAALIACIFTCDLQTLFVNNNSFSTPRSFFSLLLSGNNFSSHCSHLVAIPFSFYRSSSFVHSTFCASSMYFHFFPTYCLPHFCILHQSLPQCSLPLDATRRSRGGATSAFSTIRTWDCEETEHTVHMEPMCLLNMFKLRANNNIQGFYFVCGFVFVLN